MLYLTHTHAHTHSLNDHRPGEPKLASFLLSRLLMGDWCTIFKWLSLTREGVTHIVMTAGTLSSNHSVTVCINFILTFCMFSVTACGLWGLIKLVSLMHHWFTCWFWLYVYMYVYYGYYLCLLTFPIYFLFLFLFLFLTYLSLTFDFQAGHCRRWPNLVLIYDVYFVL